MVTKYDRYIIAFFFSLSVLFFTVFTSFGENGVRVLNIYSDGKHFATYELDNLNETVEERVENKFGSLTVYISKEKCYVKDAGCGDKLCEKQHFINGVNQTITCLPNKILIEIVSQKIDEKVDMVAY